MPDKSQKDFFISYTQADREWAEWIAWILEASGWSVHIQAWDFRAGRNFIVDMDEAAKNARRSIAVLSDEYLRSGFAKSEWAAAFKQDPTGENGVLLPVRVRECNVRGLLGQVVYVDLAGKDQNAAREILLAGVSEGRAKPPNAPPFPGGSGDEPPYPGEEKPVPRSSPIGVIAETSSLKINESDGEKTLDLANHGAATSLAWNPSGKKQLGIGLRSGALLILDTSSGAVQAIEGAHEQSVTCVAWSHDGSRLATGGADLTIKLWSVSDGSVEPIVLIGTAGGVLDLAWSPDDMALVSGGEDRRVRFWSTTKAEPSRECELLGGWVDHVDWGTSGLRVASATRNGELQLWDSATAEALLRVETKDRRVSAITLAPNEELLATSLDDGMLNIFDTESGDQVTTLDADGVAFENLVFSRDGRLLVGCNANERVKAWRTDSWLPFLINSEELPGDGSDVLPASFWCESEDIWFAATANRNRAIRLRQFDTAFIFAKQGSKPNPVPLSTEQIQEAQAEFLDWDVSQDRMTRQYIFDDFLQAMRFMQAAAPQIDQEDHHPEWSNVFNRLTVTFTTVKIGKKLTKRDLRAARLLDEMFDRREH